MAQRQPTLQLCVERLQKIDEALATVDDNRTWRHLREQRKWWSEQLVKAELRQGHQEKETEWQTSQ